jgi:hypothetical protein
MKAKQLAQVIRKIVREEVQKEVRNVLTEQNKKIEQKESLTLTEALQDTKEESYPTMKEFTSADARAGFAAMQGNFGAPQAPPAFEGHNGQVVSADRVEPSVNKALTRDYSDLVKRFKK